MGLAVIVRNRRAKMPYLVEQTGRNLYSLEELSYFLYHNVCLAGRSFFDERLCRWLEEELGCTDLAKRLRKGIASESSLTNLVIAVVGASDLYDSNELTALGNRIRALDSMQEQERLKLRADELLDEGNVWAAMEEYRHILRMHQNGRLGVSFYARIWNNLGVCCAREFLFQEAADCFRRSCEYAEEPEVRDQIRLAEKLAVGQVPDVRREVGTELDPQQKLLDWEQEYRRRRKP